MSVLHAFYTAFAQRDWAVMGACYHPEAHFSDPVFPDLDAQHARAMWKMLLSSDTDLCISFTVLDEDAHGGRVHWEAFYTFSRTGRKVHNVIDTRITLKDGLVIKQRDHFSLWRWSRQALGVQGLLLGWTPLVRDKVRGMAATSLLRFMAAEHPQKG
jgi:ketosteroid isomerase-like protein